MSDESPTPRSGTAASLDARVGRLEHDLTALDTKVDQLVVSQATLTVGQNHIAQLLTTQHQAVTAEVALVRSRYHEMANVQTIQVAKSEVIANDLAEMKGLLAEALRGLSEPQASPAGRQLMHEVVRAREERVQQLAAVETQVTKVAAESGKTRLWVASAVGALGVLVFLANLLGPLIRDALRLP